MWTRPTHTALIAASAWLLLVMLLLPRWSFAGYSLLEHTTSHLGAQGAPHAWVMNLTFLAVAVAVQVAGWRRLGAHPMALLALGVFAVSLALTGFYRHEPMMAGVETSGLEADRHSLFATTTGFGFVGFAVAMVFASAERRDRALAAVVAVLATGLLLGMAAWPDVAGLLQRAMFVMAFAWLVYVLRDRYPLVR